MNWETKSWLTYTVSFRAQNCNPKTAFIEYKLPEWLFLFLGFITLEIFYCAFFGKPLQFDAVFANRLLWQDKDGLEVMPQLVSNHVNSNSNIQWHMYSQRSLSQNYLLLFICLWLNSQLLTLPLIAAWKSCY